MMNRFLSLFITVLVAGCSSVSLTDESSHRKPEETVKVPYHFYVDSFLDTRPVLQPTLKDTLSKRLEHPFREDLFVKTLVKQVNGQSLYNYEDALLKVELKDYAAFKEGLTYTLSFYVDVTGLNEKGRVLSTGLFSCVAHRNEAGRWFDALGGLLDHDQNAPKKEQDDKKVWNTLYKECLSDIAYQFNSKVLEWEKGRRL